MQPQVPLLHIGPPEPLCEQSLPHAPQLVVEVLRLMQTPLQLEFGSLQPQVPLRHSVPKPEVRQLLPHVPQLATLFDVLTQELLHTT